VPKPCRQIPPPPLSSFGLAVIDVRRNRSRITTGLKGRTRQELDVDLTGGGGVVGGRRGGRRGIGREGMAKGAAQGGLRLTAMGGGQDAPQAHTRTHARKHTHAHARTSEESGDEVKVFFWGCPLDAPFMCNGSDSVLMQGGEGGREGGGGGGAGGARVVISEPVVISSRVLGMLDRPLPLLDLDPERVERARTRTHTHTHAHKHIRTHCTPEGCTVAEMGSDLARFEVPSRDGGLRLRLPSNPPSFLDEVEARVCGGDSPKSVGSGAAFATAATRAGPGTATRTRETAGGRGGGDAGEADEGLRLARDRGSQSCRIGGEVYGSHIPWSNPPTPGRWVCTPLYIRPCSGSRLPYQVPIGFTRVLFLTCSVPAPAHGIEA
jgi:hypothetical protein